MVESRFSVSFGEPTAADGRIAAADLAHALQELNRLVGATSALVDPGHDPAALSIERIETGRPVVDLVLTLDRETDRLTDLLPTDPASVLSEIEAAVIGPRGVLQLEHHARGRTSTAREATATPGISRIHFGDEKPVEVLDLALELVHDRRARRSAAALADPARGLQIDGLVLSSPTPTVGADDARGASASPATPDTDAGVEMLVEVAAPAFPVNNKWRLQNGQVGSFWATIGDGQFLDRVNAGEPFRKGDLLRCLFTITRTESALGNQTEHHVTKVLQHVARGQQLRLDDAA